MTTDPTAFDASSSDARRALEPVTAVRPPAAYMGGKRRLAARLVALIEAAPHTGYCEPFVGMGGVFLRRTSKPRTEVINDRSGDVANLFRILQRHYPQLLDVMRFQVTSRSHFERLRDTPAASLTDLERAARFLYLQRTSFGGKVAGRTFGVAKDGGARFNLTTIEPVLAAVHERLAGVVIECLDWRELLDRWDRPGMLHYLDPPYWGGERDYGEGMFERDDFEAIAARLATLQGSFILSIGDRPEVRAIFERFEMETVPCHYSVGGGRGKPVSELIVRG